jgi:hypothetical protein
MGLILVAVLLAGCALGLIITMIAGVAGVLLTVRSAKTRLHVWRNFALMFVIVLSFCILAVLRYPYDPVRPGNDYDIAMKNFFLAGFGCCVSPGTAVLLAALGTLLSPRKAADKPPVSN